jgi:hypothetical protein
MKLWLAALLPIGSIVHAAARSLRLGVDRVDLERLLSWDPFDDDQDQPVLPVNFDLSNCMADPKTCGSTVDSMSKLSSKIIAKTAFDHNQTLQSVAQAMQSFTTCLTNHTSRAYMRAFRKSFGGANKKHRKCRRSEARAKRSVGRCNRALKWAKRTYAVTCGSATLKQQPSGKVCAAKGPWSLRSLKQFNGNMVRNFAKRSRVYAKAKARCIASKKHYQKQAAICRRKIAFAAKRKAKCDGLLGGLEQFTCAWAQKTSDRCKAYDSCWDNARAVLKKLRATIPAAIKVRKAQYKSGMTMKCMGAAVASGGAVDAKKMNACKYQGIKTSIFNVRVPRIPRKKSCTAPQTYGGSPAYKRKVYRRLPVKVRLPALCLAWKGGCAARSTFAGAIVALKRNGKYCGLGRGGAMLCNGLVPKQRFQFQSHTSKCDGAKLVPYPARRKQCRFAPSLGAPYVACTRRSNGAKAWATLPSNPLAVTRTGKVTLKFTPLSGKMGLGSMARRWSRWDGRVMFQCSNGALAAVKTRFSKKKGDRSWKHQCLNFPLGVGSMGRWPRGFKGLFKWRRGWQNTYKFYMRVECPSGSVIAGHKSLHKNRHWRKKVEDRRFQWACRKLPRGIKELQRTPWLPTAWTKEATAWKLGCESNEVLVAMVSKYKGKSKDRIWKKKCAKLSVQTPTSTAFEVVYDRGV